MTAFGEVPSDTTQRPLAPGAESPFSCDSGRQTHRISQGGTFYDLTWPLVVTRKLRAKSEVGTALNQ